MKIAIIYKSLTGNTKTVAEAIRDELKAEDIVCFGEPQENVDADFYIVGSWTDKGMCAKEITEFLRGLTNKKIAYFGTAGFGGSPEYYEKIYHRVTESVDESNEICGYFFCQGKMPMSVRARYVQMVQEHPEDKKMQVSLENFDKALSHPDEQDLQDVKNWIRTLVEE